VERVGGHVVFGREGRRRRRRRVCIQGIEECVRERVSDRKIKTPKVPMNLISADKSSLMAQSHTSLAGCSVSGLLLAFFTASLLESCPAFGFASFVPLRCSVCFLFSAASSAARRGLAGLLSFPPPPPSPRARVVPITRCPPSSVPGFEQSPPIRVDDQGKKVNNVDPSHRSSPMTHRVLPQVNPRLRAFYVLDGDRYEVYNTCNSLHTTRSVNAQTTLATRCTHLADHVRRNFALQVQTLLTVSAVSVPPTTPSQPSN